MQKTRIATCALLLLLLLIVSLSSALIVQGSHVSVTWGSTYHNTDWDPNPNWFNQYEAPEHQDVCAYITNLVWYGYAGGNWVGNNFYGSSTTGDYVYQCSDIIQGSSSYDFLATFHVGDMFPKFIDNGWYELVDWIWFPDYQIWVPVYVYHPLITRHYAYCGSQGSENGIIDVCLYPHTGAKHRFTFIYSCTCGDLIDIDGNGIYDFYGFVDTQNNTGVVGMPFAWTQRTDLSWFGYINPDDTNYAYIGFENFSKWMCDNSEFYTQNYADFVEHFYYYALACHWTINSALNQAMRDMTNGWQNFLISVVYNGYYYYDSRTQIWWFSRMRVFGDGDMALPW